MTTRNKMLPELHLNTRYPKVFHPRNIRFTRKDVPGATEQIFQSTPRNRRQVGRVFRDTTVSTIVVVGYDKQGPAHAQNIRDSLKKSHSRARVCVALRPGSDHRKDAHKAGFTEKDGALGSLEQLIPRADIVVMLISDKAQVEHAKGYIDLMKPGSLLIFAHGFYMLYLHTHGGMIRSDIDIGAVCPKAVGMTVRNSYLDGSGQNASLVLHQDYTGDATDRLLAYAVALGCPTIFLTTLLMEAKSDITGERGILLGSVWAICKVMYDKLVSEGMGKIEAYTRVVEAITGPVSRAISNGGLKSVVEMFTGSDLNRFWNAFAATYPVACDHMEQIYREVASGRELGHVIANSGSTPYEIDKTEMWAKIGKEVQANRREFEARNHQYYSPKPDPVATGVYLGSIYGQIVVLRRHGHSLNECANESIVEAVDSLNRLMHELGVGYMVDRCSMTARLGTRVWGPQYMMRLENQVLPNLGWANQVEAIKKEFLDHEIHDALKVCLTLRPKVYTGPEQHRARRSGCTGNCRSCKH